MPTTGISLVREHTQQMQLPRFLWVPFELGRPFGAPGEPDFQRRVLHAALELLERDGGPVVLVDFPDDAPVREPSGDGAAHEAAWACPIAFHPPAEEQPELVAATLAEMERLAPWHEIYAERRRSAAPPAAASPATGLAREQVAKLLGRLAAGNPTPDVDADPPIQERLRLEQQLRLGCDDLCAWYMEAAQGQPGRGSAAALRDWFWRDTAAARLIAAAATALLAHPEPIVRWLARRALVPREYVPSLMPTADPALWEESR
ncbi:MAG: hypothetical protein ACYTGC_15510 [Planctomycetota bacterium]